MNEMPSNSPADVLSEHLDHYIDAMQSRSAPPPGPPCPELDRLHEAAAQVHGLGEYLRLSPEPFPATASGEPARPGAAPETRWASLRQVGKYRVAEILGAGGQAVTCKAWDPDLKRHVVIKLYHVAQSPGEQELILKEGQALARVRSPQVARCHAVERHEGMPYLVLEYVPGRSLADLHKDRPLTMPEALEMTAQAAEGLAAVHTCGLLHRDLKPANILVGDDGQPRLIDFGLACALGDAREALAGTLAYMAPEQARGEAERIDTRTDLFGLGAVLYELLTGGPPYQAADPQGLWRAARDGEIVPASERNPRVSPAVNELCMRCLAKDPGRRFSSAAELAEALRRLRQRRRRRPQVAAAAALLLLAALAVLLIRPWGSRPAPAPKQPPSEEELSRHPDGRPLRQDFPLRVELLGSRKNPQEPLYRITEGQLISFRIEAPNDCWVGIWYENERGTITQLFPNEQDADHLVLAGKARLVPGDKPYGIRAKPARGPGRWHVLASTESWSPVSGRKLGPYVVFESPEEKQRLRNFELETKARAVAEKLFPMQVEPR